VMVGGEKMSVGVDRRRILRSFYRYRVIYLAWKVSYSSEGSSTFELHRGKKMPKRGLHRYKRTLS